MIRKHKLKNSEPQTPKRFSRQWFLDGVGALAATLSLFAFLALTSWLAYPILVGMDAVRLAWFVPYPSGSYLLVSPFQFEGWPTSMMGIFSIGLRDLPNSFYALVWTTSTVIQLLMWFTFDRWDLPVRSRKGVTRRDLMLQRARQKLRWFCGLTLVLGLLSLPGLRVFEVLQGDQLCHRGYFEISPNCLALNGLEEVKYFRYGRANSFVGWDLRFHSGGVYTLHGAPSVMVLELLTQRSGVTSNVTVRSGRLFLKSP